MPITAPSLLRWQELTLAERARYLPYTEKADLPAADFAFAALYMWDHAYRQQLAYFEERAVVRIAGEGEVRYAYPVGTGAYTPLLEALHAEAAAQHMPLVIVGIPEAALPEITAQAPFSHTVSEDIYHADYIYEAEALATLAGKKLHAKRNHINAFSKQHRFELIPISEKTHTVCGDILQKWVDAMPPSPTVAAEQSAILRGLAAFEELALEGGVLLVDGEPAAFTIGEAVCGDTFCVHFEKALPTMSTAYPVINREFVRAVLTRHPAIRYINREDDMGLENLRRAKLSYSPCRLQRKFILTAAT